MQRIERLSRRHHREGFDCGNPELNDYLRHTARQHTDKGLSRTDVLVDDEAPTEVLGYVTVCLAEIITDSLPPQYGKKYPAKAHGVKLARLAVAQSRQRQGLGALMMIHAMRKAFQVADSTGISGLFVDAKDEAASRYYRRFGFIALPDSPHQMFMPPATLRRALDEP